MNELNKCRCGQTPVVNEKQTPLGLGQRLTLWEIECNVCGVKVCAREREKAVELWNMANHNERVRAVGIVEG
jgi:hypothetical protein